MATMDEFQRVNYDMERVNSSHLFLLPKYQDAVIVRDYQSISLSNPIYFIILKVMENRFMEVIGDLVSPLRSVFILGGDWWMVQ